MSKIHLNEDKSEAAASKASNHPIPTERIEIGKQMPKELGVNKNRSRKFPPQNVTHTIIEPGGLRDCPVPHKLKKGARYTLGDIHGNTINLLSFLIKEGFLDLTKNIIKNGNKGNYDDLLKIFAEEINHHRTPLDEHAQKTLLNDYLQDEDKLREILYNKLLKIYETEPLTMQSKALYDLIINNAAVNADASICLIGDELGDRGNNDYFTLKLLEKLQHEESKVQIDILVSNHGVEFLRMRDAGYPSDFQALLAAGQGQSAENLAKSIASGVVSRAEIESFVENGYIPNLKILSCLVDSHHVELYSHALVGLDTLEALAKKMNICFKAQTPQEVSKTIAKVNKEILDKIKNKEFVEMVDLEQHKMDEEKEKQIDLIYMNKEKFTENFPKIEQIENIFTLETSSLEYPINRIIWARLNYRDPSQDIEALPATSKYGYELSYVHGHDSLGAVRSDHIGRVTNLDHEIGKYEFDYIGHYGKYIVHVSLRGVP